MGKFVFFIAVVFCLQKKWPGISGWFDAVGFWRVAARFSPTTRSEQTGDERPRVAAFAARSTAQEQRGPKALEVRSYTKQLPQTHQFDARLDTRREDYLNRPLDTNKDRLSSDFSELTIVFEYKAILGTNKVNHFVLFKLLRIII